MHENLIGTPSPSPTDSETVKTALEVAAASWERGDVVASIRWLRRAAEAADADGEIGRMVALARAAADLEQARPADSETRAKTPPAVRSAAPSAPPSAFPSAPPSAPPSALPSAPPSAPPSTPPPSRRTLKPTSLPRSASAAPKPPVPTTAHRASPPARVRVSVRTSVRDPMLLVVRPLAEGQPPPDGAREAFLVMADDEPIAIDAPTRSHVR